MGKKIIVLLLFKKLRDDESCIQYSEYLNLFSANPKTQHVYLEEK